MLNDNDLERYARQVIIPDVGEDGQQKLQDAKVLVIGAGGLGSPVIMYLAAAGVCSITVIDDDAVSLSDLNRQIAYTTSAIGEEKVKQIALTANAINPDIRVSGLPVRATPGNASKLIMAHHVVIDCSDNVETRYLLGDLSHQARVPLVFGSAVQSEGQVSVFQSNIDNHRGSACYRCVFPSSPGIKQAPGCSQAGILGPMTGIIGAMQAMETIKLITGIGTSLTGRLMLVDGRDMSFMEIATNRHDDCLCCGTKGPSG